MKKKQIKKLVSALTVASILGTSIATPLNVMSTEAFASEASESNLVNITTAVRTTADVFQYKDVGFGNGLDLTKWGEGSSWGKIDGNSERLGAVLADSNGGKIGLSFYRAGVQQYSIYSNYVMETEVGKKYYISYDIVDTQSDTTTEKSGDHKALVRVADIDDYVNGRYLNENAHYFANAAGYKKTNESSGFTFTAKSDISILNFDYSTTRTEKDDNQNQVWLSNIQVLDAEGGAAIDLTKQTAAKQAVDALFNNDTPTSNAIKSTTTQKAIDDAQELVDAIADTAVKAARQADLDKAQSLLDAKNEAAAEQAKQTAAKQAVDALFNNDTPTSNAIKPATTQKTIDDAQKLVDAIADAGVKAARQADLDKAQSLLDAKNEAAAEQAKQTAAKQAVDALFNNDTPTSNAIKPATTQKTIDDAQKLVDAIADAGVKAARQADLDKAQSLLDTRTAQVAADQAQKAIANYAVNQLFVSNNPTSDAIKTSTDQEAIDNVQAEIDKINDTTLKAGLQTTLDRAQELLDERNAVAKQVEEAKKVIDELFNNGNTNGSLKDTTNQAAIDKAQEKIDALTDATKKAELQKDLDAAQKQLDDRNSAAETEKERQEKATADVKDLFENGDTNGSLKNTTNQAAIDKAQEAIDAVTDPAVKESLQADLDKAKALLVN
ncbi:toxin Cry1Ac domain D-VI-related protein, partial [Listeria grandensis]|uniref:toxin Cry1Ac domain D-VI-related protein n=1 Tax=Listeria grandensis TaxID=1494963 RepID=UPI001FD55498